MERKVEIYVGIASGTWFIATIYVSSTLSDDDATEEAMRLMRDLVDNKYTFDVTFFDVYSLEEVSDEFGTD